MRSTGVKTGAPPHSVQAGSLTGWPRLQPELTGMLLPNCLHQPSHAKQVWQGANFYASNELHSFGKLYNWRVFFRWKSMKQLGNVQLQIPLQSVALECYDQSSKIAQLFFFLLHSPEACLTDMKSARTVATSSMATCPN